ncbi:hypothetical protein B0H14DRAFT_3463730 [Mycena olivaceomarginata]|nr:hypothetical protein B0H14DRAFT_3463730 [Mycena olivaceomarginata]
MFGTHLEAMLTATDTGSILPTAQRVNLNVNGWRSTQQSMGVMPKAKTKARKAGDQAYGGGASSGLKGFYLCLYCMFFHHLSTTDNHFYLGPYCSWHVRLQK